MRRMFMVWAPFWTSCVRRWSSVLGRGLPEGWLCIRAICVARCIKASRRMLRTSAVVDTTSADAGFVDDAGGLVEE